MPSHCWYRVRTQSSITSALKLPDCSIHATESQISHTCVCRCWSCFRMSTSASRAMMRSSCHCFPCWRSTIRAVHRRSSATSPWCTWRWPLRGPPQRTGLKRWAACTWVQLGGVVHVPACAVALMSLASLTQPAAHVQALLMLKGISSRSQQHKEMLLRMAVNGLGNQSTLGAASRSQSKDDFTAR